jgi:hypothetical protein
MAWRRSLPDIQSAHLFSAGLRADHADIVEGNRRAVWKDLFSTH